MTDSQRIFLLATVLGAAGLWLLLPRGAARGRAAGAVLSLAALGLLASQIPPLGYWVADVVFYILAGVTVISAVAAMTFRSPVYCAIWFGLTLLGTAGLFLFTGAQFLAVATVVIYAGAILVTFLFVLMLAQPEGKAAYDRVSWEAMLAAAAGAVIVGVLSLTVASVFSAPQASPPIAAPDEAAMDKEILTPLHLARFGGELFGRHLLAVEIAGVLLLAALVGAAAIVARAKKKQE